MKQDDKYLVVKSSIGSGLGDRIRAVLSGILYALQTGRNLNVLWDDGLYGREGENIFPRLFDIKGVAVQSLTLPTDKGVFPPLWTELHEPMHVLYEHYVPEGWNRTKALQYFSFDQSRLDYRDDVLVMWDFDQFGLCCEPRVSWNDLAFIGELTKRHLFPVNQVSVLAESFRRKLFRPEMIGVHIRNSNEEGCRTKLVEESQYHALIRKIRWRHREAGIFLATDNIAVQQRFQARYGSLLVTTDKWFGEEGDPLHRSEQRVDRFQNAVEALVDMLLLASCRYLIFAGRSSFSMVASYFSPYPVRNMIGLTNYGGLRGRLRCLRHYVPLGFGV